MLPEVTKICLAVLESSLFMKLILEDPKFSSDLNGIPPGSRSLLMYLVARFEREPSERLLTGMYRMLQRFILPFLRKATIFTHVYEGIIFSQVTMQRMNQSLTDCAVSLTTYLGGRG